MAMLRDAIRLTENLVSHCAQEVLGTQEITYQGTEINLTPPWNRITMAEGVKNTLVKTLMQSLL